MEDREPEERMKAEWEKPRDEDEDDPSSHCFNATRWWTEVAVIASCLWLE